MRQQLLLGTAQWGLDYGISNVLGRIPDRELADLVAEARRLGVLALDTAPVYGDAQGRIREFAADFVIQTKVSAAGRTEAEIHHELEGSRKELQLNRLWRVLVHDWPELEAHERSMVITVLNEWRQSGYLDRFGVSVYSEIDLRSLVRQFRDISVVQLPVSIVDQRLLGSNTVRALREMGVLIQARSIFLQGILLGNGSRLVHHPELMHFLRQNEAQNLGAVEACVGFIRAQDWIDEVVIGVTSSSEVAQICAAFNAEPLYLDWETWAATDEVFLDPRRWPRV